MKNTAQAEYLPVNKIHLFEGHPFKVEDLRGYFPRGYTAAQMKKEIMAALEDRQR